MFYENLKAIAAQRNTTVTAICKALNLSTSYPTGWKKGRKVDLDKAQKIADYLGVAIDDLLGSSDAQASKKADRILDLPNQPASDTIRAGFALSPGEAEIIIALRQQPDMEVPVRKLLSLPVAPAKSAES